jgi:hypothetical protein
VLNARRLSTFQSLRDYVQYSQGFDQGFEKKHSFIELPQWLEIEEYETEFRRYFPGGIPELAERAKSINGAADAINRLVVR